MTAIMTKSPAGEDIVILSRAEYDALVAASEDAADARTAREAIASLNAETLIADEDMDDYLAAATPMAFWRKKRGLTQAALAKATGVAQSFLSEIESGKKTGDVTILRKIATALGVRLDDLVTDD
ncbi:helix-turn-helix domain-containing protein [Ancylobacter sonchi]|uniref:helix-turn-helix domain-containing protein n=1 Tax=Ancylobacter sonchi TaxID=1937790 RepID=UPI001BD4D353|nr:helix-turn-helix domain-containing protein [Ancylobacter sonchi]MBS7532112.1 helix-turn-helix domain-containing protein [Ancylobacter sonchi]